MSAHDGDCVAPCQLNCPARTDCQGYVGLIANGEYDHLPEAAFYMVGTIEQAVEKAQRLAAEAA